MAKNSGPVRTVHARTTGKERDEMIATTKAGTRCRSGYRRCAARPHRRDLRS